MDLLVSWQAVGAAIVLVGSVVALFFAIFLPKQGRSEVLRKVGRWFQGI